MRPISTLLFSLNMAGSRMYGVELESISGKIARQLYQNNSVIIDGYENTDFPDSFFDVVVGNVPFGQFKVQDKKYDKYHFLIHDYFFAKTLDKVRPGGIVAFITSRGTLDKENSHVRKYIAQRAELLGAIRLPNTAFQDAAGTEVTSDIIFLQKRENSVESKDSWLNLATDENGITANAYFTENPEMVLGELKTVSSAFGHTLACLPLDDRPLKVLLDEAIQNIQGRITDYEYEEITENGEDNTVPADPTVRNFSFTVYNGLVYYRENSRMKPVEVSQTAVNRIKVSNDSLLCKRCRGNFSTDVLKFRVHTVVFTRNFGAK